MPKSGEPTVPLFDANGDFIGELATNSSRIAVKDKSGDEIRHNGTEFRIDSGVDTPSVITDKLSSGGAITPTDITSLVGPGLQVNGSNELESDLDIPGDVSGSRSYDTWETNNTGNPIVVYVEGTTGSSSVAADDEVQVNGHVNSSQSDNKFTGDRVQTSDGSTVASHISFVVPDGAEYKAALAVDQTGNNSVNTWREQQTGA